MVQLLPSDLKRTLYSESQTNNCCSCIPECRITELHTSLVFRHLGLVRILALYWSHMIKIWTASLDRFGPKMLKRPSSLFGFQIYYFVWLKMSKKCPKTELLGPQKNSVFGQLGLVRILALYWPHIS